MKEETWITIIDERTRATIVHVDSPTGREEDYIYSASGFNRELQVWRDGELVHKSGAHHPEAHIETYFEGKKYVAFKGNDKDVFVMLEGKIDTEF